MMFEFEVNYWAVLVAALAQFVLGALWYSPALFGKQWMKMIGLTEAMVKKAKAKNKGMAGQMITGFLAAIVTAFVFAMLLPMLGATDWVTTLQAVFWLWLGFVGATSVDVVLWENRPASLWFLNNAYRFIAFYVMALVLVYWV